MDGEAKGTFSLHLVKRSAYLGARDAASLYGLRLTFYSASKKVSLSSPKRSVIFQIGSREAVFSGVRRTMGKPVRELRGEALIPLEALLAQAFTEVAQAETFWSLDNARLDVERLGTISFPRYYTYKDKTRLVFELLEPTAIQTDGSRPKKILVNFFRGRLPARPRFLRVEDGLVEKVVLENIGRQARATVYLSQESLGSKIHRLEKPRRLILDIERPESAPSAATLILAPSATAFVEPPQIKPVPRVKKPSLTKVPPRIASASSEVLRTIVLDPGHGGEDPGAVGPKGTFEKDVNLEIAKKLLRELKRPGLNVILTRENDEFVPLARRTQIANEHRADLFVSIHCNASLSENARGFEVYFLHEKATDEKAESVARLENAVVALEKKKGEPANEEWREIIYDMQVNQFMNESSELSGLIAHVVGENVDIENKGVKQANFFVLRGAAMPAILVEGAYLSNPKEEKKLKTKSFQTALAKAIHQGIEAYERRLSQ